MPAGRQRERQDHDVVAVITHDSAVRVAEPWKLLVMSGKAMFTIVVSRNAINGPAQQSVSAPCLAARRMERWRGDVGASHSGPSSSYPAHRLKLRLKTIASE